LKDHCPHAEIEKALFAVASPVQSDRSVLTNCSWLIDAGELKKTLGSRARIVNDFEAAAYSLPSLAAADLMRVGRGEVELAAPMAVLGPGSAD
jgi:glucokinase